MVGARARDDGAFEGGPHAVARGAGARPAPPRPPGGSPLRVDPAKLRRVPGARADSGVFRTVPQAPVPGHLTVVEETSAGGVVARPPGAGESEPQIAVITRRNRADRLEWCLPKGHLEGAETPEEAAVREVFEETGIVGVVTKRLGIIDYWFSGEQRRVHKVVHHFLLRMTGGYLTVEGDPDQEPEDAFWIPLSRLPSRLSYPNEQKLATVAAQLIHDQPALIIDSGGYGG